MSLSELDELIKLLDKYCERQLYNFFCRGSYCEDCHVLRTREEIARRTSYPQRDF